MRDVVVIGGGLSGLAACCELEKHDLRYTIIEVKGNFGGAISSHAENGFVTDASAFAMMTPEDPALLVELGLKPRQFEFRKGTIGFSAGTSTLIEAMTSKLTGGRLLRMAVSSIGRWQKRFTLCLENGMILDAGSVIVAAPARYAERMLFNLVPDISLRLREYHYDTIYRVSFGYHKRDLPEKPAHANGVIFPFVLATDAPGRVPDADHLLLQVGVRSNTNLAPKVMIQQVIAHYGWPASPLVQRIDFWPEADPLSCYDDSHSHNMATIKDWLPEGIGLIGSDFCLGPPQKYGVARLDERLQQGKLAAQNAIEYLKAAQL